MDSTYLEKVELTLKKKKEPIFTEEDLLQEELKLKKRKYSPCL